MERFDTEKVIYDIGMNNGDDLPYYLAKGTKVVGIEANSSLCDLVLKKYSDQVRTGQLVIENCVITADRDEGEVDFYLHREAHVLSQFPRPSEERIAQYEKVKVPQRLASSIVHQHGEPHYIKLDIEHYDIMALEELFSQGIFPEFISTEMHDLEAFVLFQVAGYTRFNFVTGPQVSSLYRGFTFRDITGLKKTFSFPHHAAGPFGEDLLFAWLKTWQMAFVIHLLKAGWWDLHAARVPVQRSEIMPMMRLLKRGMRLTAGKIRRKLVSHSD